MGLRSLQGQVLAAIAVALLIAQGLSAALIWVEMHQRHINGFVGGVAMRMIDAAATPAGVVDGPEAQRAMPLLPPAMPAGGPPDDRLHLPRGIQVHVDRAASLLPGDRHLPEFETALRDVLVSQGEAPGGLAVVERDPSRDPLLGPLMPELQLHLAHRGPAPRLIVATEQLADGRWVAVRGFMPSNERQVFLRVVRQTVLIYVLLTGAVALILRQITRPLRALTRRLAAFAADPAIANPLPPQGPSDIRQLIVAHNAMETRISTLLDEKNVMLGAIGHDLKTPLAALRVRLEAVENEAERLRMIQTIEEITRTLDDILSLARVGRPGDPVEPTDLSALVSDVIDEFADMGDDVALVDSERVVAPVRGIWVRRALRNLVSNALRYGIRARVSLLRGEGVAVLRIEDDGPGIPEAAIARMMEPFTRMDESRNSATGGAGLGLTLARAIADQHGGSLELANRLENEAIAGLTAILRLPLG